MRSPEPLAKLVVGRYDAAETVALTIERMIVKISPFSSPGQFYRGNLHTHSTLSDGARTPAEVVGDYRSRGYDFISLTDHFLPNAHFRKGEPGFIRVTDTRPFDTDDFVTILGAEVHGPAMANGEMWHLVAVGLPVDFAELQPEETGPQVVRRAWDAGAWVSLAHPYWNAVSDVDALAVVDTIHAVEVYNHASEAGILRGWGFQTAETLLNTGHRVQLNAADDAHFKHPDDTFGDAFGGWVQVKAESLEPEALVAALKAGAYYSSTGPEIHDIELTETTVRITSSPVKRVILTGAGAVSRKSFGDGQTCVELELPSREKTPYVRVTVFDDNGGVAWSNPIWPED
jgi:hypothetical protein